MALFANTPPKPLIKQLQRTLHVPAVGIKLATYYILQYKGRISFAYLSLFPTKHGIPVTRNYFETSHGKNPCDGLGGTVKRLASNAVLQKKAVIRNAEELNSYCNQNLTKVGDSSYKSRQDMYQHSSRSFIYVNEIKREHPETNVKTLLGSRKLHSVQSTDSPYQVKIRPLSCYCKGCISNSECHNQEYMSPWKVKVLKLTDPSTVLPSPNPLTSEAQTPSAQTDCGETEIKAGQYVAVQFKSRGRQGRIFLYVGKVLSVSRDEEATVQFMQLKGKDYIEKEEDICQVALSDVVKSMGEPILRDLGSRPKFYFPGG